MAYKDVCFTQWLTKKDIKKILELNNMELCEESPNAIFTHHKENGETSLVVSARHKDYDGSLGTIASAYAMPLVAGILLQANGQNAYNANNTLIELDNFTMVEMNCGFISDEDALEYDKKLTKNYQVFMQKKFGEFYNTQKSKYINKLIKQEEKQTTQESEEKEV